MVGRVTPPLETQDVSFLHAKRKGVGPSETLKNQSTHINTSSKNEQEPHHHPPEAFVQSGHAPELRREIWTNVPYVLIRLPRRKNKLITPHRPRNTQREDVTTLLWCYNSGALGATHRPSKRPITRIPLMPWAAAWLLSRGCSDGFGWVGNK